LHLGTRNREQFAHPLLDFLEGLGIEHGVLPRRRRFDAIFPKASIPGARDMRLDSRRLESVLDDVQYARRVTRGDIHGRHTSPDLRLSLLSRASRTLRKAHGLRHPTSGRPPDIKRGPFAQFAQYAPQHFTPGLEACRIYRRDRHCIWSARKRV